jgi:hypothetical protein
MSVLPLRTAALTLALALAAAAQAPAAAASPAPARAGSSTASLGEALQPSSSEQKALGEWLRQRGVIFYGAWWCPACFQQKNLFGKEAGNRLPYVECDKEERGRRQCRAASVRAFPTWVMGDQRLEGVQSIEQLKRWSGFPVKKGAPAKR